LAELVTLGQRVDVESIRQRKDGTRVHVSIVRVPVSVPGGQVAVYGIYRDITERKRAEELLQTFSQRLIETQEAERRRVARELRDEIGQALTALKLNLETLRHSVNAWPDAQPLQDSISIVDRALQQVRELASDLCPSLLDDLGLVAALRWYVDRETQRAGLMAEVVAGPFESRLPPELETACFRIAQQALTNIVQHAQARHVWVELRQHAAELQLVIRDDGIGFDVHAIESRHVSDVHLGLQGRQERALILGGQINITSTPGHGTEVHVRFPLISSRPLERGQGE
jgi:signal transduction histidine kinase